MKTIVSGIQPTGELNIGTYLGSIKNFVALQKSHPDHRFFLFIADTHALTVPQDPIKLRAAIKSLAAMYVACGINLEQTSLFVQSEITAHQEMDVLLQSFAYMGELERMTQFKDKAKKQVEGIRSSLFTYPVLMAGDILLYDAEFVPVGDDQKQHLELTRTIAERVNHQYEDFFTVPKPLFPELTARVMSLQNPEQKMSKSDPNVKSKILLSDPENIIKKRIRSAVTDSEGTIRYDPENKKGLSNLLRIYAALEETSVDVLVERYKDANYQTFKDDLGTKIAAHLAPIQERYHALMESQELSNILDEGKKHAEQLAIKKVQRFKKKLGLGFKR